MRSFGSRLDCGYSFLYRFRRIDVGYFVLLAVGMGWYGVLRVTIANMGFYVLLWVAMV